MTGNREFSTSKSFHLQRINVIAKSCHYLPTGCQRNMATSFWLTTLFASVVAAQGVTIPAVKESLPKIGEH